MMLKARKSTYNNDLTLKLHILFRKNEIFVVMVTLIYIAYEFTLNKTFKVHSDVINDTTHQTMFRRVKYC
jgi:hypothetical protein